MDDRIRKFWVPLALNFLNFFRLKLLKKKLENAWGMKFVAPFAIKSFSIIPRVSSDFP